MRFLKYLLVPWTAIVIYSVVSVSSGAAGIVPYRLLLAEREKILENLEKLELINQELEGTMDALLYDPEAIRVRARELGYGEADEYFVRIVGLPGARYSSVKPGMVRTAAQPFQGSAKTPRIVALCISLLSCGLFLAGDLLRRRKKREI